jgi:hypothetical protein
MWYQEGATGPEQVVSLGAWQGTGSSPDQELQHAQNLPALLVLDDCRRGMTLI